MGGTGSGRLSGCRRLCHCGAQLATQSFGNRHYATKGDEIAFVEVKSRSDDAIDPLSAITSSKVRHMVSAANAYLRTCRAPLRPRFDVAAVTGDEHDYKIRYISDAFLPPLRTYR